MYPFTTALLVTNKPLREEALSVLQEMPARVLSGGDAEPDVNQFMQSFDHQRPDVLLVEASLVSSSLGPLFQRIESLPVKPVIIALNTTPDSELILSAMRAGANEFLFPPFAESLRSAIERRIDEQRKKRESGGRQGRIVAFVSAKGGCGATTVACHVAADLQRQSSFDILLADMDFYSGMVHFLMKTKSKHTIEDAFTNLNRLDASFWRALISNGTPRLEVITAPDPANLREMPTPEQCIKVLNFMRSQYDWTIVDLGRNMNFLGLSVLDQIDETCLLTTLEVPALHRAKQILQKLVDSGYGRNRLRLVLNRVPSRADITPLEIEKMFGWPVYALLPDDTESLYECYAEGRLLPPSAKLSHHVGRLTRKLTGIPEPKEKGFFRLFG